MSTTATPAAPIPHDTPGLRDSFARLHHDIVRRGALPMWVVTRSPTDAPGLYVARLNVAGAHGAGPTIFAASAPSLKQLRAVIPPGLFLFARITTDDPVIVETWL